MKYASLSYMPQNALVIIDAGAQLLRLEQEGHAQTWRLKPYHADCLYALFSAHPTAVPYSDILRIFKGYNIAVTDETRIHRKFSELRQLLDSLSPLFEGMLINTRGVGYSIAFSFSTITHSPEDRPLSFKDKNIADAIRGLKTLIQESIKESRQGKIIHHPLGYIMRTPQHVEATQKNLKTFAQTADHLIKNLRMNPSEFFAIRVDYLLARLKTYIGFARISEYPISLSQWLEWYEHEVWQLFEELQALTQKIESID